MVTAAMSTRTIGAYRSVLRFDPCAYCGGSGGTIDHIDARQRGGRDTWENLTSACARCNAGKGDLTLLARLGRLKHAACDPPAVVDMIRELVALDSSLLIDAWDRACAAAWSGVGR